MPLLLFNNSTIKRRTSRQPLKRNDLFVCAQWNEFVKFSWMVDCLKQRSMPLKWSNSPGEFVPVARHCLLVQSLSLNLFSTSSNQMNLSIVWCPFQCSAALVKSIARPSPTRQTFDIEDDASFSSSKKWWEEKNTWRDGQLFFFSRAALIRWSFSLLMLTLTLRRTELGQSSFEVVDLLILWGERSWLFEMGRDLSIDRRVTLMLLSPSQQTFAKARSLRRFNLWQLKGKDNFLSVSSKSLCESQCDECSAQWQSPSCTRKLGHFPAQTDSSNRQLQQAACAFAFALPFDSVLLFVEGSTLADDPKHQKSVERTKYLPFNVIFVDRSVNEQWPTKSSKSFFVRQEQLTNAPIDQLLITSERKISFSHWATSQFLSWKFFICYEKIFSMRTEIDDDEFSSLCCSTKAEKVDLVEGLF